MKLLACAATVLALVLAGCGGDDEGATSSTTPTIEPKTPTGPTGPEAETGGTEAPGEDAGEGLDDGTVEPPPESDSQTTGSGGSAAPEDSPENDVPPEPGSPEAEFEQFCEENPEACG